MSAHSFHGMALLAGALWASAVAGTPERSSGGGGFQVPTPAVRTLANGVTVAVFQNDRLPLVQVQLLVAAGSEHDPVGESGVANLTLRMLTQGTASRTAGEYAAAFRALGGSVSAITARDFATLSAAFVATDFEAGIELLADAALHPVFGDDELAAMKDRVAAEIRDARLNPARLADDHLWATVFTDHPYGRSPLGESRTIPGLGVEQLRAFHRDHYRPNRVLLAIAGDVTPERAFRAAEEVLGAWGGQAAESTMPAPAGPRAGWHVRIVDAADVGRAELRFGTPGPSRGAPDYDAMRVATELLRAPSAGGGLPAVLTSLKDGGMFSVSASVPVDSVRAEVARVRKVLARWTKAAPAESSLVAARRHLAGSFPLQFETLDGVIAKWMAATFFGLPAGSLAAEPERVGAVSAEQVVAAAARWAAPTSMNLVVVGPAQRLRPLLEGIGTVEVVSTEKVADVVQAPSTATAPPTREQLAKGREIAALAVAAHGGLARLRQIHDSSLEGDVQITVGSRALAGQMVQLRKEPMRFLFTTKLGGVGTMQILDGDHAWASAPGSAPAAADSAMASGLRSGFRSDLQHLLLAAVDSSSRVAWRGRELVKDREADVIEVLDRYGERRVLFLGATDHRLMAMEQNDHEHSARRVYLDLRDVNGVLWPYYEERLLDGERTMTFTLRRVATNTGVKDEAFRPPPSDTKPETR